MFVFLAWYFHRLPYGLLRWMWLVDNDIIFAGNRSIVYGSRSTL